MDLIDHMGEGFTIAILFHGVFAELNGFAGSIVEVVVYQSGHLYMKSGAGCFRRGCDHVLIAIKTDQENKRDPPGCIIVDHPDCLISRKPLQFFPHPLCGFLVPIQCDSGNVGSVTVYAAEKGKDLQVCFTAVDGLFHPFQNARIMLFLKII